MRAALKSTIPAVVVSGEAFFFFHNFYQVYKYNARILSSHAIHFTKMYLSSGHFNSLVNSPLYRSRPVSGTYDFVGCKKKIVFHRGLLLLIINIFDPLNLFLNVCFNLTTSLFRKHTHILNVHTRPKKVQRIIKNIVSRLTI